MVLYVHIVILILEIIGYQKSSLKYSWKVGDFGLLVRSFDDILLTVHFGVAPVIRNVSIQRIYNR